METKSTVGAEILSQESTAFAERINCSETFLSVFARQSITLYGFAETLLGFRRVFANLESLADVHSGTSVLHTTGL